MNIAVYCSANNDIAEEYYDATRRLGEWMANAGHTLVWGGGNCGLMGCIGDTVHALGGRTIGMVPRALETTGRVSGNIDVYIPTDGLDDRKELMTAWSDIAVALPGGIGTLDEIFTQAGSNTIGFHKKKVILYNVLGFWDTTIALLDFMQENGMVRGHWSDYIVVADSLSELSRLIGE
ncbi:MAG: TIGR00730 family Rossman fold protein [Bacteroidales bacterium]|nr:TIGR00730 family Rossman fold protein [Bacteroidales bacterium]MCM1146884.1 TIGR00730 family Rossman fold protein [Bacteroidales bacterium]MCM1205618.1 TIGR00730 family Rossman fold protein [Bacillota bacterium]MCM1510271.1 TIGR00730 family Rossman fold protein [Clostridium sp.]